MSLNHKTTKKWSFFWQEVQSLTISGHSSLRVITIRHCRPQFALERRPAKFSALSMTATILKKLSMSAYFQILSTKMSHLHIFATKMLYLHICATNTKYTTTTQVISIRVMKAPFLKIEDRKSMLSIDSKSVQSIANLFYIPKQYNTRSSWIFYFFPVGRTLECPSYQVIEFPINLQINVASKSCSSLNIFIGFIYFKCWQCN